MDASKLVMPGDEILIAESGTVKRFAQKKHPTVRNMRMIKFMKGGVCQRVYYQYNRGIWTEGFSVNNLPY